VFNRSPEEIEERSNSKLGDVRNGKKRQRHNLTLNGWQRLQHSPFATHLS
jgi:hypothetical protein